jgi:hypothetical protein
MSARGSSTWFERKLAYISRRSRREAVSNEAAGGVLTDQHALHPPGIALALGLRAWEMCRHSAEGGQVGVLSDNGDGAFQSSLSQAPLRPARCARRCDDTDARKVAGHAHAVGGIELGGIAGTHADRQEASPAPS